MDDLSNELSKLKIDRSKRAKARSGRGRHVWAGVAIIFLIAIGAFFVLRKSGSAMPVDTVRPRLESSSQSAVLIATGYVIAHHKIQVGSKIMGRVAWIGVEKGA